MASTRQLVLVLGGTGKIVSHHFDAIPGAAETLGSIFGEVLDGRNARLADGVQRALGREPRDFSDYAREAAASGVWDASAVAA